MRPAVATTSVPVGPEYVLLVEDNPGDARLVELMFDEAPAGALPRLHWMKSARAAADHLAAHPGCRAVLLDLGLPDNEGLDALHAMREHATDVPLIVLSGNDDEDVGLAAVVAGAQDYLVKGSFDASQLRRALTYAAHRKRVEQELIKRAMHDPLTGLPTRTLLLDRLRVALRSATRNDPTRGALLFIDLDRFKQVNDLHGHAAGDALLRAVATRMLSAVRGSDTVARVGGDEFVVLLPGIGDTAAAEAVAQKLLARVQEPVDVGANMPALVGASIGLVMFDDASLDAEALIAQADEAMYMAKSEGRSSVVMG